jgi:hypothetical protein
VKLSEWTSDYIVFIIKNQATTGVGDLVPGVRKHCLVGVIVDEQRQSGVLSS